MKFKVVAIIFYVISSVLFLFVLAGVCSYFLDYKPGSPKQAEASDLIAGLFGIFVISAMFFFIGRIFFKKWRQISFSN